MANITITGSISYSAAKYGFSQSVEAGEALIGGYACYIKPADRKAYHAGTAVATGTTQVQFDGFVMRDYVSGDAATLIGQGSVIMLDGNAGLAVGDLWLGATAGVLSDAKVAGADTPVARAITTSSIRVLR